LLQRRQDFKVLVIPSLSAALIGPGLAIAAATAGMGAYSLAIREVAAAITEAGLLLLLSGYRPRLSFDRSLAREIIAYARHLLGANLVAAAVRQLPASVLARLFGASVLGGYALANRLATLPTQEAANILNRVLLPHFSARRHEPREVQDLLLKTTKLLVVFGVPLSLAISWFAAPALHLLYGSKWDHAIPFFQILPIYALLGAVASPYGEACKGLGRTRFVLEYFLVQLGSLAVFLPIGVLGYGPVGLAWAMVLSAFSSMLWLAMRTLALLQIPRLELIKPWQSTAVAGAVAAAGVVLTASLAPLTNAAVEVCVEGLVGMGLFALCILLWDREFVAMLFPRTLLRPSP
jgi:PST family polysaccharide transporter